MNQRPTTTPTNAASNNGSLDETVAAAKDTASQAVREIAREAKSLAGEGVSQAKQALDSQVKTAKERAVGSLGTVADALRHTRDHLRLQDEAGISGYVGQAADQVDNVSTYLKSRTFGQLMGDVESFARREPALFLGGALVAGIVTGRFLKSSRVGTGRSDTGMATSLPSRGYAAGTEHRLPESRSTTAIAGSYRASSGGHGGRDGNVASSSGGASAHVPPSQYGSSSSYGSSSAAASSEAVSHSVPTAKRPPETGGHRQEAGGVKAPEKAPTSADQSNKRSGDNGRPAAAPQKSQGPSDDRR